MRGVSMGKLKTVSALRSHQDAYAPGKLNAENLKRRLHGFWTRLSEKEEDLGADLSQSVLVCHLDMIVAVLNFLGIPHEDGFFRQGSRIPSLT
jgi:hypothetical protein